VITPASGTGDVVLNFFGFIPLLLMLQLLGGCSAAAQRGLTVAGACPPGQGSSSACMRAVMSQAEAERIRKQEEEIIRRLEREADFEEAERRRWQDQWALLDRQAQERNQRGYQHLREKLHHAGQHYPPRNHDACESLDGTWYGKCERIEQNSCTKASYSDGVCTGHIVPKVADEAACAARGGRFVRECDKWDVVEGRNQPELYCARDAIFGTCREDIAGASATRDHVPVRTSRSEGR
jgi:hypothetical protein